MQNTGGFCGLHGISLGVTDRPGAMSTCDSRKRTERSDHVKYLSLPLIAAVVLAGFSDAAGARRRQRPSPTDAIKDTPALPRALLIGDSIPTNGGPTTRGLEQIDAWLGDGKWDVVHFNWGLHDLKYIGGKPQVAPDQYAKNLQALVLRLKKTGAKLIFATTTPVPKGAGGRIPGDSKKYNAIARKVMAGHGVAVNDLYGFALPREKLIQRPANVHFHPAGSALLAGQVAAHICRALGIDPPRTGPVMPTATQLPAPVDQWTLLPALSDEFEGKALDAAKWHPNNPDWKGRKPGFFHTKNVAVRDGKLQLTMKMEKLKDLPEGYHTYTSAAVKSKATVRYGYFEIKCRPMDSHGSSAFWFYRNTPEIWTEIDVFEIGAAAPGHEHTVHTNAHVFHTSTEKKHWSKSAKHQAPFRLADDYHVYALLWTKEALTFYLDGEVIRTMTNTHWHQPLHMNFDSETMPKWFGLPKADELPATFTIEYIRSWQRKARPTPAGR